MATGAIGIVGTILSVGGSIYSAVAQQQMVAEQTAHSKRAENAREQQMQLDSSRRRRQSIRESIMARAMSLSVGVSQGAQHGSGVIAGMGQATAMGAEQQQGVNAAQTLGSRVFESNRQYHAATQRGSAAMAIGQGISSIGGMMVSNAGTIDRLGTYYGNRPQQFSPHERSAMRQGFA